MIFLGGSQRFGRCERSPRVVGECNRALPSLSPDIFLSHRRSAKDTPTFGLTTINPTPRATIITVNGAFIMHHKFVLAQESSDLCWDPNIHQYLQNDEGRKRTEP